MKNDRNENQDQQKLTEINLQIERSNNILITSHQNPDGDSVGSQIALGELLKLFGKKYWIYNDGEIPKKYRFLDPDGTILTDRAKAEKIDPGLIIVVECPNFNRIGWVSDYVPKNVPIMNIDHHQDNQNFGTINYIDKKRAAVAEMIYDLFKINNLPPNKLTADAVFLAIYTDTGRFRHDCTTPEALRTCAELMEHGADPTYIADNAYYNYPLSALKLRGEVLRNIEMHLDNRVCFLTVTGNDLKKSNADPSEIEGLIDYGLFIDGVLAALLFKNLDNYEIRVGFRCREGYSILDIARKYGGGGHCHAAGCSYYGTLEDAKKSILEDLRRMFDGSR